MSSEPPLDALQTLAELGIINIYDGRPSHHAPSNSNAAPSHVFPIAPTGSLGRGFPQRLPPKPPVPKKQPSLFWKAIGFLLKKQFSSVTSLEDNDQALFFADPNQSAIPAGGYCPTEPNETEKLIRARKTLLDIKEEKDQAWNRACSSYTSEPSNSPPAPLIDVLKSDASYQLAWTAEKEAQNNLTHLLKSSMVGIASYINELGLADMRLDHQKGSNMPVVAVDQDWIQKLALQNSNNPGADPSTMTMESISAELKDQIYYRPAHEMNNYASTVSMWYKSLANPGDIPRDGPHRLDLAGIWNRSWADLGHPLLDAAAVPGGELSDEKKKFLDSLSATVTFVHKPYKGKVTRGKWDVNDPRQFQLQSDAPSSLAEKVFRTSSLIMAWGIEIELTLPTEVAGVVGDIGMRNITLDDLNMPLQAVDGDGNKMVFRGGGEIPILLGAFADLV
ncbi:hypothetical protein V8F06_014223 [Rhypophila decipiens]